jgi:hypothetical protein
MLYLFADILHLKYGKLLALLIVWIGYFLVLPLFFFPELDPSDRHRCGMPIVGIMFAFWIIGGGISLLVHLIYCFLRLVSK